MWIDSHCHLNHPKIKDLGTPDILIKNAKDAGVGGMLTINCRISNEFDEILQIANSHENVWCTLGTHPHEASNPDEACISQPEIVRIAQTHEKVIGLGETGLDYYYNYSKREDQVASFRKHIRASIEADLPIIIHARDADEDIARILFKEEGAGTHLKGLMHCFSSGLQLAERALDFGFYISFSGIVTFKQSEPLQTIAKMVPLDRILVETDAPFLAPTPHRGKINQPSYTAHTGEFLANLKNLDKETFSKHCFNNFFRLFSKAKMV